MKPQVPNTMHNVSPASVQTDLGFERVDTTRLTVPVHQIEPTGDRADHSLVEAIRLLGIQHPILLRDKPGTDPFDKDAVKYVVVDGRRRMDAARRLGLEEVPASIVRGEGFAVEALALSAALNINRSANVLDEAESIGRLRDEHGFTVDQLSRIWPRAVVQKRLRLYEAPAEIKTGVSEGRVAPGTAEQVANLPSYQQAMAVARLNETGRLTRQDVLELRQARKRHELEALPDDLFGPAPELEEASREAEEYVASLSSLTEAYEERRAEALIRDLARLLDACAHEITGIHDAHPEIAQAWGDSSRLLEEANALLARVYREFPGLAPQGA